MKVTLPKNRANLIPLSEDERLTLIDPREFFVLEGEQPMWDEVTVIGRGERRAISVNIHVEDRARASMIRVFDVPEGSRLTLLHKVSIGKDADWQNVICIRGRGEVKIRRSVEVLGQGGGVKLACLAMMDGSARIAVADEIFSHAPETTNDIRTKIVLKQQAHSEVRARIVVDERSMRSQSYERLDHLILGDQARANAVPELEVKTDDVQCGHGATITRPAEDEMFFLTSRGLAGPEAERLIAQGFLSQAMTAMSSEIAVRVSEMMRS